MFVHDVTLPTAAFRDAPRRLEAIPRPLVLISVATLDQIYKGQDLLIDAVARCVRESFDLRLVFVGDGKFRSTLEHHARQQGVGGRVVFKGHVPPGEALWSELDAADLFVLPSKADALPKAVVEAMARALPCIGSTVGEFPRLLAPEDLVRPNDLHSLVATLQAVAGAPQRMTAMSARNLQNARRFHIDQVSTMRTAFYREVREKTKASGSAGGGRIS